MPIYKKYNVIDKTKEEKFYIPATNSITSQKNLNKICHEKFVTYTGEVNLSRRQLVKKSPGVYKLKGEMI